MCTPKKPDKPDILPEAPPPPEEAPVAPTVNEDQTTTSATKRAGRKSLRIDLNPAGSAATGNPSANRTALRM